MYALVIKLSKYKIKNLSWKKQNKIKLLIYINFIETINYKNDQSKKLQFYILRLNIGGIYRSTSENLSRYYKKNVQNNIFIWGRQFITK